MRIKLGDYDWERGKVSGTVYKSDKNLTQLMGNIYRISSYTNPLHPDVFPGVCKMEAEVVRITCNLFNGDEASCGTVSIFSIFIWFLILHTFTYLYYLLSFYTLFIHIYLFYWKFFFVRTIFIYIYLLLYIIQGVHHILKTLNFF